MKRYVILAIILIASMSAYPQATRSATETKSDKGSSRKETVHRSSGRTEVKSGSERKTYSPAPAPATRSKSASSGSVARSSGDSRERARVETRSSERPSANVAIPRSSTGQERARTSNPVERTKSEPVKAGQDRTRTSESIQRNDVRTGSSATRKVETGTVDRPENRNVRTSEERAVRSADEKAVRSPELKTGNAQEGTRTIRQERMAEPATERINTSSASRTYREGKGTLTRDDGTVIRHQNDEVFASRKYKLDFDNYESLRRSDEFRRYYHDYDNWNRHRVVRVWHNHNYRYHPLPIEVRRVRYVYRHPVHIDLFWTPLLLHRFMYYYPTYTYWDLEFGQPIETISAYDASYYAGTVRRIYGKVEEVFYSREDNNYVLYIGAPFPYQDLSIVIPQYVARDITRNPEWYFDNEMIWVVGLIQMWEGKPEIVVRDEDQIRRY